MFVRMLIIEAESRFRMATSFRAQADSPNVSSSAFTWMTERFSTA